MNIKRELQAISLFLFSIVCLEFAKVDPTVPVINDITGISLILAFLSSLLGIIIIIRESLITIKVKEFVSSLDDETRDE